MSIPKPKALIYCRVASRTQGQENTDLMEQETRCRTYAATRGYDVVQTFSDTTSAHTSPTNRPGMTVLLAFIDDHLEETYTILIDSLTRYARDSGTYISLQTMLNNRDVKTEWPIPPSPQTTHKMARV
jgi:DNA invertase Pin-like site-specific DNA recombinase